VTSEKETSDRMQILLAELDHRTRNLIVVIGSIVKRTLAASDSLQDFKNTFDPRLTALGHVNALLLRPGQGGRVTFDALLKTVFRGHGLEGDLKNSPQIRLSGEKDIQLKSSHVQTLGLALHELLTNAMKYGALADEAGKLNISWILSVGYDLRLDIEWLESRVPIASNATLHTRGYGRELIEEALPYQLKAVTSYDLRPERLRCTISLSVAGARSMTPSL
jgi:two-component sensor histidine kinase